MSDLSCSSWYSTTQHRPYSTVTKHLFLINVIFTARVCISVNYSFVGAESLIFTLYLKHLVRGNELNEDSPFISYED